MFTEAQQVHELTGIKGADMKYIMKNYSSLITKYPQLVEKARRIIASSRGPKDNTTLEKALWLRRLLTKNQKLS